MALSVSQKIKLRVSKKIILTGVVLGLIYIVFVHGTDAQWFNYANGAVVGLVLGSTISFFELLVFSSGVRKMRFAALLTLRTTVYLLLITFIIFNVVAVSYIFRYDRAYLDVLSSFEFKYYLIEGDFPVAVIFALVFAFSINFTRLISRKIGQGMLLSHITGTYYTPVTEFRIVMFLNIANSKKISEKLGAYQFHHFLKEFFFDITPDIVTRQGIIYEYVDDLVVISWNLEKGTADANCIRIFFEIKETLKTLKENYYSKYGFMPKINAALHTGELVRAEIGDIKTQIVFHGDVMNTCSRVLGKTNDLEADFLITRDLLDITDLPLLYDSESVGDIELRGKGSKMELFKLWDKELTKL